MTIFFSILFAVMLLRVTRFGGIEMNVVIRRSPLAAKCISLLIACGFFAPAISVSGPDVLPHHKITISTQLADVDEADIDEVEKEAGKALRFIPAILKIEDKPIQEIRIVDSGICYESGGVIFLPESHIRDKRAAIIHEITHALAKHGDNSFFTEGLAVYFQDRFGGGNSFPNYAIPLDNLVRDYKGQLMSIVELMHDNAVFNQLESQERLIAYIEAGSFTGFLVEAFGEEKLAELHKSPFLDYKKVYGREVEELEEQWRNYVMEAHK